MSKLSGAYRTLFIWVFASLVALAGYIFLFTEVKKKNESVSLLVETLAFEVERAERLKSIDRVVEDTLEEREALEAYFLKEDEVVSFLTTLEGLSRRIGADFEVESANVVGGENDIPKLSLEVSARGSRETIVLLFDALEVMPYVVDLTHIELVSTVDAEGRNFWEARFSFDVLMRT